MFSLLLKTQTEVLAGMVVYDAGDLEQIPSKT